MTQHEPSTRREHQADMPIIRVDVSKDWEPLPHGSRVELVTPPRNAARIYHLVRGQRRTVFRTPAALEAYLDELAQ